MFRKAVAVIQSEKFNRYTFVIPWLIILIGTAARTAIFIQNRNLFIDEANLARNIYERSFAGLCRPLAHDQFAPPLFLWMVRCCTSIAGFGEMSLRFYTLAASVAALIVFYILLKQLLAARSLWYPLAMMVVSFIYLRYATELKQYMPDVLVALLLLLSALRLQPDGRRFVLKWAVVGSLAIWASMPAVFVLAGVGAYYACQALQQKSKKQFLGITVIAFVWVIQFGLYYWLVLRSQIGLNLLQEYHREFFLFLLPKNAEQWNHNRDLVFTLFKETSGYSNSDFLFARIAFVIGIVILLFRHRDRFFLFVVPLLLMLLAAALHQFSLITRVALFSMPLMLIIVGVGLDTILSVRYLPVRIAVIVFAMLNVWHHSSLSIVTHHWDNEEITSGMDEIKKAGIKGNALILENSAEPAFIYYTQIHPARAQWADLQGAYALSWNVNLDSVAAALPAYAAFLCTAGSKDYFKQIADRFRKHSRQTGYFEKEKCYVFFFERLPDGY